ncbi:chromate transporter [Paenibacillus yanchengensis]|uniref:Chromate transporter n=1 Tax=Paenibacillus yanchengensis TaxID=2035833 RepID=A0ABW4YIK7_9BACL
MLWQLFITFLKVGLLSFGGGYAVIPLVQYEASTNGWLDEATLQNIMTIAGSAPGPIATNGATLIGYHTAGIWGAIVATAGIVLPSLLIVILLASILFRHQKKEWFKAIFYGLRAVVTGLIIYACIKFGFLGESNVFLSLSTIGTFAIAVVVFLAVAKWKWHPLITIILAASVGMLIF